MVLKSQLTCSAVMMIVDSTGRVAVGISADGQISVAMRLDTLVSGCRLIIDAPVCGRRI